MLRGCTVSYVHELGTGDGPFFPGRDSRTDMCGICGIVDYSGAPIDRASLNRVRDSMTLRGPDDCGTQILPFVGLGHRRLSIIDLSSRGRQPMTNEDGSVWLV